jgi:YD repeat-containing protein
LPANDFSAEPRSLRATGFRIPRDIAIAPNGNLLAYAEMETQSALWYVPLHAPTGLPAGRPLPLTRQSLRRASLPVFSPDGALIAYSQRRAGTSADIHIMNADGTEERAVTFGPSHDGLASWNPDGSAIVFNSESEKSRRLVQISLNGRTESVLPFPLGEQRLARLSPDGQRVASHQFNAGTVSTWITQLDGSRPIRLAPSVPSAGFPVWSPDGARLAVEVFRGNSTALGIVSAADPAADARLLIDQPGQHWPWSWDPAGRRIALATRENGRWALEWISVSSGARQTFASEQSLRLFLRYPAWSPRGDRIVYERSETRGNIHLLTLLQPGPPAQPPSNSPAGRFPVPGSAPAGTRRYP